MILSENRFTLSGSDHAFQDHALVAGWRIATIGPQDNMHYDALWNASQNPEPPAMDRASRFD
jgi:hypothetical protein